MRGRFSNEERSVAMRGFIGSLRLFPFVKSMGFKNLFFACFFVVLILLSAPVASLPVDAAEASASGSSLHFAERLDDACLARIRNVVSLASRSMLSSAQKAELFGAFSSFSKTGADADGRCRQALVEALSVLSFNASGFGVNPKVGAFDAARGQGTVFSFDNGSGGLIHMRLVASAPDRVGFDVQDGDAVLCRWPDSECILENDVSPAQRVSPTLAVLFHRVRVADGLVFFESQPLPRHVAQTQCRLLSGTDWRAPVQVAFAPSLYANSSLFLEDLSRELDLLKVSLGPLYRNLAVAFTKNNVACEPKTRPDARGYSFYRCDVGTVQESCGTNYVVVLVAGTDSLRGSAAGTVATCRSDSFGCVRHELGHSVLGLSDRYCCDGAYHLPNVYDDASLCAAFVQNRSSAVNASYREYLVQLLADVLERRPDVSAQSLADSFDRILSTSLACTDLDSRASGRKVLNQKSLMQNLRTSQFSLDELDYVQRLFNATPKTDGDEVPHALLQLEFNGRNLTLNDFRVVRFPRRTALPVSGTPIRYTFLDMQGKELASYVFADPRMRIDEEDRNGSIDGRVQVDPTASYSLLLPYSADAQRIDVSDADGSLASFSLNASFSSYCRALSLLSDGFCEPLCASDVDCASPASSESNPTQVPTVLSFPESAPSKPPQLATRSGGVEPWIILGGLFIVLLLLAAFGWRREPKQPTDAEVSSGFDDA